MSKLFYQLQERTFLNADSSKVVPEDSNEAAVLLGPKGFRVPMAEAERLGLVNKEEENEVGSGDNDSSGSAENVEPDESRGEGEVHEGSEQEDAESGGGQGEKAAELPEDKAQKPAENKGVEYPKDSQQYLATMTILMNNDVDLDHLPNMLDADLLAIDGISRTRLGLIREHYPAEDDSGDTDG